MKANQLSNFPRPVWNAAVHICQRFQHQQLGPRLTQGATYCVKHTQAPSSLNRNALTKPAGTCPNGQAP